MGNLKGRIDRLEDPRPPAERQRAEERARVLREQSEAREDRYRQHGEQYPERYKDLLDALDEYHAKLEELGVDLYERHRQKSDEPLPREARAAMRMFSDEQQRFWHGYASGFSCESCGRPAVQPPDLSEGRCRHCEGTTSSSGAVYGLAFTLDALRADTAAIRRMGHDKAADRLEQVLTRRLQDSGRETIEPL